MLIKVKAWDAQGELETIQESDAEKFFLKLQRIDTNTYEHLAIEPSSELEARGLLSYYTTCVRSNSPPPRLLSEWIAGAFEDALQEDRPADALPKALGLVGPRRGPPRKEYRDQQIHSRMEELIATGKTVMVAAGDCAEEFRIHEANIQKIYYAWRKFVVSIPF